MDLLPFTTLENSIESTQVIQKYLNLLCLPVNNLMDGNRIEGSILSRLKCPGHRRH